jgi:hypothetical protein
MNMDAKKDPIIKNLPIDSSSERNTTSEGFSNDETDSSTYRKKRKKHSKISLTKEFRKAKPLTFNGEVKKGEEVEAWLMGLKNFFRVHNYSGNMKSRLSSINLIGGASI